MKSAFFTIVAAALAAAVNAYTTPVGANPQGNPIYKPGANERVPVGKPYTITWTPTSAPNTVTLVLLRGPSTNILPLYPIVEKIPNTGSYTWTPSTALENDVTHYGIQLIDDVTGFYQYTTQFGVQNDGVVSSSSAASSAASSATPYASSAASSVAPVSSKAAYSSVPIAVESAVPSGKGASSSIVYSTHVATVTACDCTSGTAPAVPVSTGSGAPGVPAVPAPGWNGTTPTYIAATPSGTGVSPVYNASSSSPVVPEQYTGAAAQFKAGGVMMAVVAGMAIALF